ncbi:MAG: hypothetical protein GY845_37620 [Planctomycetes bacterium]|nr:hypothetical protein [Planctomycetota bacterium]
MEKKLNKFMKYIQKKYDQNDTFRGRGEYPWPLIRESGVDFGDGKAQLAAMNVLLNNGYLQILRPKGSKRINSSTKIVPNIHLERGKQDWSAIASAVIAAVTEGAVKAFKP